MPTRLRTVIPSNSGIRVVTLFVALFSAGCTVPGHKGSHDLGSAQPATSVCDILGRLAQYREQMVTVTGIYWYGLRQSCAQPLPGGLPMVIDFATSGIRRTEEPVSFTTDWKSWEDLERLVKREATAQHKEEIWVTAVGMLRALGPLPNGKVIAGYGHLGAYPAQFVVQRIISVSIKPIPTYDYAELLRPTQ